MNFRALALGAALGFVFALSPSCTPQAACNATNCAGCCDADKKCQPASPATCGASGNACIACSGADVCQGGVCTAGGAGGGGGGGATCESQGFCPKPSGGCGTFACANGCCIPGEPFGKCSTTPNPTLCGKNNAQCGSCNTAGGETCQQTTGGSQCVGGGGSVDAGVGTPCGADTDCGAPYFCKTVTNIRSDGGTFAAKADGGTVTGIPYTGGYCTRRCNNNTVCGQGNTCLDFAAFPGGVNGETEKICVAGCQTDSKPTTCRDGYACLGLSSSTKAGMCFVDPDFAPGVIGSACTTRENCGDNFTAGCIPATGQGGATGFPNGYCTADCDQNLKSAQSSAAYCGGPKGLCVTFADGSGQCFERCASLDGGTVGETSGQGTCVRSDHVCWGGFNNPALGMCVGNCTFAPTACATGKTCQTTGENTGFCCSQPTDGGTIPDCNAVGFQ